MVLITIKVKRQLKRKETANYSLGSNPPWRPKWINNNRCNRSVSKSKTELPRGKEEIANKNNPKSNFKPSRNRSIKCLGSGQIASQYPNKSAMIMHGSGQVMNENESDINYMLELEDASEVMG